MVEVYDWLRALEIKRKRVASSRGIVVKVRHSVEEKTTYEDHRKKVLSFFFRAIFFPSPPPPTCGVGLVPVDLYKTSLD